LEYADFAQEMQDSEEARGGKIANTILIRPIINLFNGEYKGADFRKKANEMAQKKQYLGKPK